MCEKLKKHTPNEGRRCKNTLETSAEDVKIHSKRVEKMQNYTRNEWRRSPPFSLFFSMIFLKSPHVHLLTSRPPNMEEISTSDCLPMHEKTTLETSGEDVKTHSKRVEKM
jgi:hypothetical protein